MTCPHCQTWILDGDHRCRRCGRRFRAAPQPVAAERFPITNEATARDYQFQPAPYAQPQSQLSSRPEAAVQSEIAPIYLDTPPIVEPDGQTALFSNPNPSRVVSFDQFASPAERESIRARAAEALRPEPVKHAKMEVRHARPRKKSSANQQVLDFFGAEEVLSPPQSHIICDAPVAPNSLRFQAVLIDSLIMFAAMSLLVGGFFYLGGWHALDKHTLPYLLAALMTIPVLYKSMWAYANRDSFGTTAAGLVLVDFDGNPPSQSSRYQRLAGSFISLLAAGIGLVWALVDEDSLTWHDHISSTFVTLLDE